MPEDRRAVYRRSSSKNMLDLRNNANIGDSYHLTSSAVPSAKQIVLKYSLSCLTLFMNL